MKPARSATSTASLPHAVAKAAAASMVSSLAVSGRTTSTSVIIGAGLKKWMPHTWSGRWVCHRQLDDRQRRGVGGEDGARACTICVELGEQRLLDGQVLDDGLDHEVAVGQVVEVVGGRDPAEDRVARRRRRACPCSTCAVEAAARAPASMASAVACWRERTTTS